MSDENKKRERTPMKPLARKYRDAALAFFHKPDVTNERELLKAMKAHRAEFIGVPIEETVTAPAETAA